MIEKRANIGTDIVRQTCALCFCVPLEVPPSGGKKYRGLTARLNYLGQDRSDIQYAVKELSRCMADLDEDDMGRLKRVVRYLKGAPRFVNRCN